MNQSTILIVDDSQANRDTLNELLATEAFQLVEASDGPAALQLASEAPPDLVLLDVMMPGMDGFEVCRRLRADSRLAEVPVIMVTALDDHDSRITALEAGADDFIAKPFNRAELRARVRTVTRLNRYRRLDEQRQQFQWIVENSTNGYVLVNAADEICFANLRARLWLGLPPDGEGKESFLAAASRVFVGQPAELWRGWPDIPAASLGVPRLLVRPETPQARAFFLEVTVLQNSGGRLLRLSDVTDRLTAQRDHRAFQMMVSHKLRTPLNGLLGTLELLADPAGLGASEIAEFASLGRESAERLASAVYDVLRFAELSRPLAQDAQCALAELEPLARSVAEQLGLEDVTVSVEEAAKPARIACTSTTLEWALFELLENSLKFHPQHAPTVEVDARLDGNGRVVVTVGDYGVALSPEQLVRAGSPFVQSESHLSGEVSGMGLGLASVAAALWQAGGAFRIYNQTAGPGIRVELQWPLAEVEPAPGKCP